MPFVCTATADEILAKVVLAHPSPLLAPVLVLIDRVRAECAGDGMSRS
jgi:hypothetical protein